MSHSSKHDRSTLGWLRLTRSQSRKLSLFVTVLLTVLLFSIRSTGLVHATSPGVSCAVSSEALGGQGFQVAGLGFQVAGLGFQVAGLGFQVAGLGFQVAGLGLDPLAIAAEMRDNTITVQWLQELLPYIVDGPGYNTVKTAVLVIDDRTHGAEVMAVFDALKNTPGFNLSNIKIEFVDISLDNGDGDGMGYSTDDIDDEIREAVDRLWGQGYRHFVLNMSFGVVPCDDPGPTFNGIQYPWDFYGAQSAVAAANANGGQAPQEPVVPVLECVYYHGYGNLIARFGYNNPNAYVVNIANGSSNKLTGFVKSGTLPTLFEPGAQTSVFEIRTHPDKGPLTWTLNGLTATATKHSTPCTTGLPNNDKSITPILECVADNGNGTFTAHFGYNSTNPGSVFIEVDKEGGSGHGKKGKNTKRKKADSPLTYGGGYSQNYFNPSPKNRNQPFYFLPGKSDAVFKVVFNGSDLTWTIKGPDKVSRSVTASSTSTPCAINTGYGIDDYLSDTLGVPPEFVDDYLTYVSSQSGPDDTDLDPLRLLLRQYINRSQSLTDNGNDPFLAFPVASSGNFRPWLGAAPLSPANWPEVISVGATVGNKGAMWDFSQNAAVLSPGVAFPYGNNTKLAGTSFAAPFTSMYLAQWATYPKACNFPIVGGVARPPLTQPNALGNQQVTPSSPNNYINAFTCVKPVPPQPTVCNATDVVYYGPGKRKDGKPINSTLPDKRDDATKALGAPQNNDSINFVSLGFEGTLVLGFDRPILNKNGHSSDFRVWETSYGDKYKSWSQYPERVKVYASKGGSSGPWIYIGETSDKDQAYNLAGWGDDKKYYTLEKTSYIKLRDNTDKWNKAFGWDADGFDVDAVEGFACGTDSTMLVSGNGKNNKRNNRNNANKNADAAPVVPGLRGTDPLLLVPTSPSTTDSLIPVPAAP